MIVENIIPRNVIINRGAMWLSTEAQPRLIIIFRGMIFSTITQSGNVIFILLYRTLDPLFSTVLGPSWWGEFQSENNAQPLYRYAWMKIHLSQKCFFWTVCMLELIMTFGITNYVIKSRWRQTLYQAASFKWRKLYKMRFCCKIENFAKIAQIWLQHVPLVLTKKTSTHTLCFWP